MPTESSLTKQLRGQLRPPSPSQHAGKLVRGQMKRAYGRRYVEDLNRRVTKAAAKKKRRRH